MSYRICFYLNVFRQKKKKKLCHRNPEKVCVVVLKAFFLVTTVYISRVIRTGFEYDNIPTTTSLEYTFIIPFGVVSSHV